MVRPSTRTVIMLWHMRGCGHCQEFRPRFYRLAQPYQEVFKARLVQIVELDAAAGPLQPLADHWKVQATPTTIAAQRGAPGALRLEGAVGDRQIADFLESVAWA